MQQSTVCIDVFKFQFMQFIIELCIIDIIELHFIFFYSCIQEFTSHAAFSQSLFTGFHESRISGQLLHVFQEMFGRCARNDIRAAVWADISILHFFFIELMCDFL